MVDWVTTKIASNPEGLPRDHATSPHLDPQRRRRLLQVYGAVTRQAQQAGCSRQTVYQHARQLEQRLDPTPAPPNSSPRISGFAISSPP